ncbi:unnamed protein product [Ectocarpus sp. CCAP 1310/34]|nr:unnamed protein product [Ectocarpus sp. CCAP 1310/34]
MVDFGVWLVVRAESKSKSACSALRERSRLFDNHQAFSCPAPLAVPLVIVLHRRVHQKNLLEEVADLTGLLEDEAAVKADDERRSRRHLGPKVGDSGGTSNAAANDSIPSSELRRYGKKLEEAVRSREHAAGVAQRLALPRQRAPGLETGCGGKDGRKKGRGGTTVAPVSRSSRCSQDLPGSAVRLQSSRHRGPGGGRKASIGRGSGSIGSGPSVEDKAPGEDKAVGRRGGGGERGALATKLRGTVRASREEEVADDDKFWK